jgi:hypothetical protein
MVKANLPKNVTYPRSLELFLPTDNLLNSFFYSCFKIMNALLKKQPKRSTGGSASLTPSRNTKKTDRRENANDAIKLKLGVSVYDDMQTQ